MKSIWLKIMLILLMLVPVPFSCTDKNECLDLYVEPYYDIQGMVFSYVDLYYRNKAGYLLFEAVSQDFDKQVYPCDSLALYVMVPDTLLRFHSQQMMKPGFSFMQEAFACNSKRPGYAGTRELVDKIYISSNYDFDETHAKDYDLSDIVDIFAYTANDNESWKSLREYNMNSPYEAPKRFYLLLKRKPTLSKTQQFVIKYYMATQPGEATKYYIITTPVFQVR
jgi:hypothetical protein